MVNTIECFTNYAVLFDIKSVLVLQYLNGTDFMATCRQLCYLNKNELVSYYNLFSIIFRISYTNFNVFLEASNWFKVPVI